MISIRAAFLIAVSVSTALARTPAAPQSGAEAPKAPPIVGGSISQLWTRAPTPVPTSSNMHAATGSRTIRFLVTRCAGFARSRSSQERNLHELWQELARAATKPASPLEKKYGDFFATCMDVEELQKKGLESLIPALERISALNDSKSIATLIGDLAAAGDPTPLFGLDIEPDPKDSSKRILSISQGGLTLPDRENYGVTRDISSSDI